MLRDSAGGETLRFQIEVPRSDYRALVARLRGDHTPLPPAILRSDAKVTALIDLLPDAQSFSVTRIDHHRLPRAVSIKAGSPTHHLLAQTISSELSRINDPVVVSRLQSIIAACPSPLPTSLRVTPADFILSTDAPTVSPLDNSPDSPRFPVRTLTSIAPTILLDIDDVPTLVIPDEDTPHDSEITRDIVRSVLRSTLSVHATVSGNTVSLTGRVSIPILPDYISISLIAHWGSYDEFAQPWQDESLALTTDAPRTRALMTRDASFTVTITAPIQGCYGVSFYALLNNSPERIWLGQHSTEDCRFTITRDDPHTTSTHYEARRKLYQQATTQAREILRDPTTAPAIHSWFHHHAPHLSLGAILASETLHSPAGREVLETAIDHLCRHGGEQIANAISNSFGVGEIVFVTPEGPHAAAGGLAHVITGLPRELANLGIPVTIIAPLYRYANGNKHRSAEKILNEGVLLGTEHVIPRYVTTVTATLGPTHYTGTGFHKRPPTSVPCKVYTAQSGKLRLLLLANSASFDRLYQPVYADEQLRRAILFSRASLETIATEALDIRPSVVISNDWMTAYVPSLLALDPRYQRVPWLRQTKALHMIHNGGADYHGRLPLHFGNEDLWPLFGLAPEHYFGFRDPHRGDLVNLTMAAVRHASGGVLTVSQPYAQELVSPAGGDGLEYILQHRRDSVFGISNGINRDDIDQWRTAHVCADHGDRSSTATLVEAKAAARSDLQRRLGLLVDPDAAVLSFVGRLAEQKGLDLLSGTVTNSAHSTLEDILVRHPKTQVVIAGPLTANDRSAVRLRDTAHYLHYRYPGRIATICDYISHSQALEIMLASTLFLMPSRFEPGGITQLEALAVGTPVVGRRVGGISATIENYEPTTGRGTGFLCNDYTPTAFANTIHWALSTCAESQRYRALLKQATSARHSWADRAPVFVAVVQRIILGSDCAERLEFLAPAARLVAGARA